MRQEIPEKGRISGTSQVYLLLRENEDGKSAFRLHSSFLSCVLDGLYKASENPLWYLFVRKLLKGQLGAPNREVTTWRLFSSSMVLGMEGGVGRKSPRSYARLPTRCSPPRSPGLVSAPTWLTRSLA